MNNLIQFGHGKRGCRPEEFKLYSPNIVYCICNACEYTWNLPVDQFLLKLPESCPVCKEKWIDSNYIVHNEILFEYRLVPKLIDRRINYSVFEPGLIYGNPGIYNLEIFKPLDLTSTVPEFIKKAYIVNPNNPSTTPLFSKNILKVLIEEDRAWKKSILHQYRTRDAVPDI